MEGHIYFFFIMNALFYNELLAIHDTNAFLQALLLHTLQIIYLACHLAYLCHFFDTSIHTTQSKALGSTCLSCYCKIQGGRIKMRSPPKVLTGNFRPSQLSFFLS